MNKCEELQHIYVSEQIDDISYTQKVVQIGSCGVECVYTYDDGEEKLLTFYGSGTLLSIDSSLTTEERNEVKTITITSSISMIGYQSK